MGIRKLILNNFGLKLLSLLLAIASWFYIVVELNKATPDEKAALERLIPYRMTAKYLSVQPNLEGEPAVGYAAITDQVIVKPDSIMVIGPRNLLDRISSIRTEPIDISEAAKTLSKDVSLLPLARGLTVKEKFVTVTVPIVKK